MFRSVRIQNFRQFKDLKLKNLGRINLITGQNNTGKTSLLEALFLLATPTNPESVLTMAQLRGTDRVEMGGGYAWGFIFRAGQAGEHITLSGTRADGVDAALEIGTSGELEAPISHDGDGNGNGASGSATISTTVSAHPALEYEYQERSGSDVRRGVSRMLVSENERSTQRAQGFKLSPFYFLAHGPSAGESDAERFSRLVQERRKNEVIEALRAVEPRLVDLVVLALRPSTVSADLGSGPLIPASYMGRGFERLLTLILALVTAAGGMLLVDEIEDGLHYSVMPAIWKAIIAAAHKHDVQIFATTHSLEAINAAVEGSESYKGSLAFYRLERRKNGNIEVIMGEDHRLRSAVKVGTELR